MAKQPSTPNSANINNGPPTPWYHSNNSPNNTNTGPNQPVQSDDDPNASTTSRNQSVTGTNSSYSNMLGRVVQFGKDSSTIKGYFICGNKSLFALECSRPFFGYNGICPGCDGEHMKLAESRGFYAAVESVYESLGQQKLEKERLQGRKQIDKLNSISDNLPPLNEPSTGKNKGIEGDSNSCYMDATIFCMFAYSNVFDSLLHMKVDNNLTELQTLLRENIVHVLRSRAGFVERDAMFNLRVKLSEATGDQSFKEMEKDPSEFLRALEVLFHYAPLKTVRPDEPPKPDRSNVTTNIIWEMFDANPHGLLSTTIAGIFRNSLSEIPAKLATIPPFLVLVAPRHARSQRSYRYIIPDREIILDNSIVQLACLKCGKTNHGSEKLHDFYACNECFLKESSLLTPSSTDANIACYCPGCQKELHSKLSGNERADHVIKQIKPDKHKLNLFAVLCIETSHYVAFVKCKKQNQEHDWLFFDSMSDRIHNEKNVSCVSAVPDFDKWIEKAEKDQDDFFTKLDERRAQGRPTSQTFSESSMRQLRLFRDGAFFFYENSSVNYH